MQEPVSDELDLRAIVAALWAGRWTLIGTTAAFSVLAVALALMKTPIYRAEAMVQVRDDVKSGGGFAAMATQFGALGDLAGLFGADNGDKALTLATIKSRTLIQQFIQDQALMPVLYEDLWDPEAKRWNVENPKKKPTLWHAHKLFIDDILRVSEDKKTGLVTIAVEWTDADVAATWVTELISRTNVYLRGKTIQESERNLTYLQQQLRQTGQVELQQAAYALVESEMKKLMLAKGNEEYAIKTIDPAQAPQRRIRPNRVLIAVSGFLLGGFTGLIILFVQSELRPRRPA
jgi:uncharacterized protein involved in exopolysaccharide biosynthesis